MLSRIRFSLIVMGLLSVLLGACGGSTATPTLDTNPAPAQTSVPQASPSPEASPTPTATPVPLALTVNGEGVPLAEFEAELQQLREAMEAQERSLTEEELRQRVTDDLIDRLLLAQGAAENGYTLDEAALQAEIDRLAGQAGGEAALRDWQARNGYGEESFRSALRLAMAAAWQRDQIAESVPADAEQVRARQILTLTEETAQVALRQVNTPGANFTTYAFAYDNQIGGDLGWFPRGYLTQPAVEAAAFALQPGQISEIIQSEVGYHILQVIAREVRPLAPDARRALQRAALQAWLAQRRGASTINTNP